MSEDWDEHMVEDLKRALKILKEEGRIIIGSKEDKLEWIDVKKQREKKDEV